VATEDIDIFDQDHMTIEAFDPEGNLTERKIIFSASQEGDPLVSDARKRSDRNMQIMEAARELGLTTNRAGKMGAGKMGAYPPEIRRQLDLSALKGVVSDRDMEEKYLPDPSAFVREKEKIKELIRKMDELILQRQRGLISDKEFKLYAYQLHQGTPYEEEYNFFNKGGSVDSQDIFGYSLGGSVSEMMGRTGPSLTPAQAANLAGAFADPYGGADLTGNYPEFPSGDMSVEEMLSGPRGLSLVENILQGNYGSSALQIVGAIPGVGGIIKVLKAAGKIPPAQVQALKNMGLDVDTTMYHGTVDAGPEGKGIDEFVPGGPSGYQTLTDTGRLRHPTAGIGTWFSDSPEMASRFATSREGVGSPNVLPVYTRRENPLVFTFDKSIDEAFQKARDAANNFNPKLMKNADGSLTDEYKNILLKYEQADRARKHSDPFEQFMIHIGLDPEKAKKFYQEGFVPEEARQKLIEQGYDSVEIRGTTFDMPSEAKARGERGNQFLILDPKNIRSKYAKGDPKDRDSANISKAGGGPVEVQNMRFGGVPVPYRRGYRGPIDPSFNYGQAPQMFGRMFANRTGIGALPFIGRPATNLFSRGFRGLGRVAQFLPGAGRLGNALNRAATQVNRVTAFQDRMNPQNVMTSGIGRLFSGGSQQGGKGMLGLRGKGGLLGFGLLGGRGTPRQAAMQQYGGAPSMLGSGAFASSYVPNIGEDVVTGRQDSSTRNVPNYTGTIESGDFDIFENPYDSALG